MIEANPLLTQRLKRGLVKTAITKMSLENAEENEVYIQVLKKAYKIKRW